jgi:hypothetical protein
MRWHKTYSIEGMGPLTLVGRKSFHLSNQEAHRLQHTEQSELSLLLGLIKCGYGVSSKALASLEINLRVARHRLGISTSRAPFISNSCTPGRLPLSPNCKEILSNAIHMSTEMSHAVTGTGHLLLSLVSQGTGIHDLLARLGVNSAEIRSKVLTCFDHPTWIEVEAVPHPYFLRSRGNRPGVALLGDDAVNRLGDDPETGLPVFAVRSPFGPYIQCGEASETNRMPPGCWLPSPWDVSDLTLEVALQLLTFPRTLGPHPETGADVVVDLKQIGATIRSEIIIDGTQRHCVTKLVPEHDVLSLTLEQAVELLNRVRNG